MKHEDYDRATEIKREMDRLAEEMIELHPASPRRTLLNKLSKIIGRSAVCGYPNVEIILTDEDRMALHDIRYKKLEELRIEFENLGF